MKKRIKKILTRLGLLKAARVAKSFSKVLSPRSLLEDRKLRKESSFPIPPARLIFLVIAHRRAKGFIEGGKSLIETMSTRLAKNGANIKNFSSILDFGCGCGRMIRHLPEKTSAKFYGCDYNAELIEWDNKNLPFAEFQKNELAPPSLYDDAMFDLIYARSVFTHLDDELQKRWMADFRRILKPNGYLYFSTHGEIFLDQLTSSQRQNLLEGNLVVFQPQEEGHNICTSFELPEYVRNNLLDGFEMTDYFPGNKNTDMQDVYLLKKLPIGNSG